MHLYSLFIKNIYIFYKYAIYGYLYAIVKLRPGAMRQGGVEPLRNEGLFYSDQNTLLLCSEGQFIPEIRMRNGNQSLCPLRQRLTPQFCNSKFRNDVIYVVFASCHNRTPRWCSSPPVWAAAPAPVRLLWWLRWHTTWAYE